VPGSAAGQYLSTAVRGLVVPVLWDVRGVVTVGMNVVVVVGGGEMWKEEGGVGGIVGWTNLVRPAEDIVLGGEFLKWGGMLDGLEGREENRREEDEDRREEDEDAFSPWIASSFIIFCFCFGLFVLFFPETP
jgi:hypothetical protein